MTSHVFQLISVYSIYPRSSSQKSSKNKSIIGSTSISLTDSFPRSSYIQYKTYSRWIVLLIGCLSMFASNYCYDNVVALQNELQNTYNLSNIQYNLLYSVYSFPNILIPTFAGILVDSIGVNITVILFFGIIVIGHGIFIAGCWSYIYPVMLTGRFIFGVGSESFQSSVFCPLAYEYFNHKELALSLALLLATGRLGSSINDTSTYYFFLQTDSIIFAYSIGFMLLCISMCLLIALIWHRIHGKEGTSFVAVDNGFKVKDLTKFDAVFWVLTLNCAVTYGCVMSWMNIGTDFLQKSYGYSQTTGNTLLMIPYIIGSISTPVFGFISDHIGKRTQFLFVCTFMLCLSHFLLGWEHSFSPILALCGLGISYSIFCAVIWPSLALVADVKVMGTAYGLPTSCYNLVVSIDYIIVGALTNSQIVPQTDKYLKVEIFLLTLSFFSGVSVVLLMYFDRKTGCRLEKPAIQK